MRQWLRIIGILEIIGGAVGIIFIAWQLAVIPVPGVAILIALVIISVFALSIIGGLGLLRGKPYGRTISIIVQAIQLFKLVSPPLIFLFSLGLDFYLFFMGSTWGINFGFQINVMSAGQIYINNPGAPFGIGVSVTAAVFLASLLKAKGQKETEQVLLPPPPPPSWE